MFGAVPTLDPMDIEVPGCEIHLVPAQRDEFGRAEPVAKHQQDDRRIAHGMPAGFACRLDHGLHLRKYAKRIGLDRGYSAHSMRATFITTALENGAGLEDVQLAAGHADPSTTKLYDRRGYNPEKSASFFANY